MSTEEKQVARLRAELLVECPACAATMPAVIYKNMDEISTIQERAGGGTDLWAMGRNTWVQETPAQILALIKEDGR